MENCEHGRPVHYPHNHTLRNDEGVDFLLCWCCGTLTNKRADEHSDPAYCPWCDPAGGPPIGVMVADGVKVGDKIL